MTSNITHDLVELDDSTTHALALEYRLSTTAPLGDRNPFPAALKLDALAGYNYLVNGMGYSPFNIIMAGDSAGGNLALALTRYLVEHKMSLPHLRGISYYSHLLTTSHDWPGSSSISNITDYLGFRDSGRGLYSWDLLGSDSPFPFLHDAQVHFEGFPRTFLAIGTVERFYDSARTLRSRRDWRRSNHIF